MASRSESLAMALLHNLQEARPLLAYSALNGRSWWSPMSSFHRMSLNKMRVKGIWEVVVQDSGETCLFVQMPRMRCSAEACSREFRKFG